MPPTRGAARLRWRRRLPGCMGRALPCLPGRLVVLLRRMMRRIAAPRILMPLQGLCRLPVLRVGELFGMSRQSLTLLRCSGVQIHHLLPEGGLLLGLASVSRLLSLLLRLRLLRGCEAHYRFH